MKTLIRFLKTFIYLINDWPIVCVVCLRIRLVFWRNANNPNNLEGAQILMTSFCFCSCSNCLLFHVLYCFDFWHYLLVQLGGDTIHVVLSHVHLKWTY